MEFLIDRRWDGKTLQHEPVQLHFETIKSGLQLIVDAPFFGNNPVPPSKSGHPCANLWDYEGNVYDLRI